MRACALVLCLATAAPALAETLYRCPGNVYQREPCADGRRITVDPNINLWTPPKPGATTSGAPDRETTSPGAAVVIPVTPPMEFQPNAGGHFYSPGLTVPVGVR